MMRTICFQKSPATQLGSRGTSSSCQAALRGFSTMLSSRSSAPLLLHGGYLSASVRGYSRTRSHFSKAGAAAKGSSAAGTPPTSASCGGPTQRELVYSIMASENVYHSDVLEKEVNSFFEDIDLPMTYYLKFSPQQISNHVHAIIAAKEMAKTSGKDEIEFKVEGLEHGMFVCSLDGESMMRMEQHVGNYVQSTPARYSCSVFSFHSKRPSTPGGASTVIYIVTRDGFTASMEEAVQTDDIGVLATKEFLSNRTAEVRAGYQEVLRVMHKENIPIFYSFSNANGHTHFTLATGNRFVRDGRNVLPTISRVAKEFGLNFENKVVETFANGTYVFTYHAPRSIDAAVMEKFLFSLEQLLFTPASLQNMLTLGSPALARVESSTLLYFHLAITFADYFVSQHSDEYAALLVETANHPRANFHLCNLQKKLIMDSVTYNRVVETIINYAGLALEIFDDFIQKTRAPASPAASSSSSSAAPRGTSGATELNSALYEKVRKQVLNPLDLEILQQFLIFNSVIRHTNFHRARKAAVCVQLSEQFLDGTPFASQNSPVHGVFLSLGIGLQGFLTMRSAISRCSFDILMPYSPDEEKRLVSELYVINDVASKLMHGKNKDVPESGAGCTMVLSCGARHARRSLALQFVTSILSVLDQARADPTVVLWGPGANSHDLMDDIVHIARRHGNPYAFASAAGKSRGLGGLTDRRAVSASRHEIERFVYEKMNVQANQLTKIIVGSIHETRVLDELAFSQEKIIAVVDGDRSVLYNSDGLNQSLLLELGRTGRDIREYALLVSDRHNGTTSSSTSSSSSSSSMNTDTNTTGLSTQFFVTKGQNGILDPFTRREQYTTGELFCERFLAHPCVQADVLVLCEKRVSPMSRYDLSNFVHAATQEPKFRFLFEGVDMPITEDTRSTLERKGMTVLKDTITNKGTGMRSSYEIFAALCLSPAEYEANMLPATATCTTLRCESDPRRADTPFYTAYANDVVELIRQAARRDVELLWKEHTDSTRNVHDLTRSHITNEISKKVTRLSSQLMKQRFLSNNPDKYKEVLALVLPRSLLQRSDFDVLIQRLPEAYKHSLLVKAFTNAYVQRYGLSQDEFCFYEFVKDYLDGGSAKKQSTKQ